MKITIKIVVGAVVVQLKKSAGIGKEEENPIKNPTHVAIKKNTIFSFFNLCWYSSSSSPTYSS